MPASEEFYEDLKCRLRVTKNRSQQDKILDLWLETSQLVTEYDAELWGLDKDKEMSEVLYMISRNDTKVSRTVRRSQSE